jgi:HYR domain-containing protein
MYPKDTISGVPANITALATSASGAAVTFETPSASDLVDGPVAVSCTLASGSTFPVGASTVTCGATDKHGNYASKNFTVTVQYNWSGFYSPIENTVVNRVKAGSAIPIKFSLGGNMGLDVFAAGYPISAVAANFDGVVAVNDITDLSIASAGGSSLTYDPLANQYIYVWKTDKAYAGTNRQLQVKLKDGTVHIGNFSFTK